MTNEEKQQPCEEDILKLFYVESSDDYLIGRRLDTMYYAEWNFELQAFVWTYSNLSEPKEIPFSEWIKGFLKKYGGDVLEKIRAEIEDLTYYCWEVSPRTVIDDVLEIIDKHKAESEKE